MTQTRRDALRVFALGGGLIVAAPALLASRKAAAVTAENLFSGKLGPYVQINSDNSVTIGAPVPDMGTGVETALPMIVAEELDVVWSAVRVERMPYALRADADGALLDLYTLQGTGGSGSVRKTWPMLRDCGALARHMLVKAAAAKWGVPLSSVSTKAGYARLKNSTKTLSYASLSASAAKMPLEGVSVTKVNRDGPIFEPQIPKEQQRGPRRKAIKDYTIVGTAVAQENILRLVKGEEKFGIDLDIPGQQHAVIERCPYFDGDVVSFNADAALKVSGVTNVIKVPGLAPKGARVPLNAPGVAVVATSLWAAQKGRERLEIVWDKGPNTHENEKWQKEKAANAISEGQVRVGYTEGNFEAAYEKAAQKITATYTTPHFAHMNMEPLTAAADVRSDSCLVTTSHQNPPGVAEYAMNFTGLAIEKITVKVGRIGCGFGRKYINDFVAEALYLSKEVGTPVKVFWTREDEVQHDLLNPPSHVELKAGIDADGKLTAWHVRSSSPGGPRFLGFPVRLVPNLLQDAVRAPGRTPLGAWRGPGNNTSGYCTSSFMDEVAIAMGKDPLDLWLELLGEPREFPFNQWIPDARGNGISTGKMATVLRLVAEKSGWGDTLPEGWGRGIGMHFTFGGYAAFVTDVRYDDEDGLVVERVVGAADCGMIINTLGATAQMESGVHDGLSTALHQHVRIEGGRITSGNFDAMPLLRIDKAPRHFEMHFVKSEEEPWGTGEIGLPAFIPSLMNSIFAATGKRIRDLPIGEQLSA
ncbi:MAG: xanthine dehydrogenase family protein molybdopterin-binding subunit [Kordiimonadaceae bacterium]|nr:xanthine dehydrogenase family protein molybdopterin-binding subunit [Kordiimonadaceae bacterium]